MDVFLGATLSTYFKKIHFSYVVTVCTLKSIQYYAFELLSHIINFFYRRTLIDFVIGNLPIQYWNQICFNGNLIFLIVTVLQQTLSY